MKTFETNGKEYFVVKAIPAKTCGMCRLKLIACVGTPHGRKCVTEDVIFLLPKDIPKYIARKLAQ